MQLLRRISILSVLLVVLVSFVLSIDHATPARSAATPTFIDSSGNITGQVRVLCFATNDINSIPHTDVNLNVVDGESTEPLPSNCNFLAAMQHQHTQPSGKNGRIEPAYDLYTTSWNPDSPTLKDAAGEVKIEEAWPLTLFHVVVSMGWEPAAQNPVTSVQDVMQGLQAMSAELYDWTEGQMAVGPVSIHTNGERWSQADIRILPANDKRPSALVGGIVSTPTLYNSFSTDITYIPGAVTVGRLWNGTDASDEVNGRWLAQNASRTLTHEWMHYALFLYDEYQQDTGERHYCICDDLNAGCTGSITDPNRRDPVGSAMAYQYTATELWHKETHLDASLFCFDTAQFEVHEMRDWDTLMQWGNIQNVALPVNPLIYPIPKLVSGPQLGFVTHLFDREPGHRVHLPFVSRSGTAPGSDVNEPLISVFTSPAPGSLMPSQVYLLDGGSDNPDRILPQGTVANNPTSSRLGEVRLVGVSGDDTVRVFVDQYRTESLIDGGRFTVDTDAQALFDVDTVANSSEYKLEHHFDIVDGEIISLTVSLEDANGLLEVPLIQLCGVDADLGCPDEWEKVMTPIGGDWSQAVFNPLGNEMPRYLVVRIRDGNGGSPDTELLHWIMASGGAGSGHKDAMTPTLDDVITVHTPDPLANAGDCNFISYQPAMNTDALDVQTNVSGIVGQPLDVTIALTIDQCAPHVAGQDRSLPITPGVILTFSYEQAEIDLLSIDETKLTLLNYDQTVGSWIIVNDMRGFDSDLNWISGRIDDDGIYAIGILP